MFRTPASVIWEQEITSNLWVTSLSSCQSPEEVWVLLMRKEIWDPFLQCQWYCSSTEMLKESFPYPALNVVILISAFFSLRIWQKSSKDLKTLLTGLSSRLTPFQAILWWSCLHIWQKHRPVKWNVWHSLHKISSIFTSQSFVYKKPKDHSVMP